MKWIKMSLCHESLLVLISIRQRIYYALLCECQREPRTSLRTYCAGYAKSYRDKYASCLMCSCWNFPSSLVSLEETELSLIAAITINFLTINHILQPQICHNLNNIIISSTDKDVSVLKHLLTGDLYSWSPMLSVLSAALWGLEDSASLMHNTHWRSHDCDCCGVVTKEWDRGTAV